MKKAIKYILLIVIVLIGALALYLKLALPNVGKAPDLKVEATPERIERGKYLANNVCACMDCHSTREWSKFSGPLVEGTLGKGGEAFDEKVGFPGKYYSKNITPAALKDWTDGEIFRAITSGVSKDGQALFPVMPYPYYGKMDEEDIHCIIAYLRSIQPIENATPDSKSDFPMNFIINTLPKKQVAEKIPAKSNVVDYGRYLSSAAACIECHTPASRGQIIIDKAFSGGREFSFPNGSVVRSSNISPDETTGIGTWSADQFVQIFKIRADSSSFQQKVGPNDFNTLMPWAMYGKMEVEDLKAIFAYLKTLKGITNQVEKFTKK